MRRVDTQADEDGPSCLERLGPSGPMGMCWKELDGVPIINQFMAGTEAECS